MLHFDKIFRKTADFSELGISPTSSPILSKLHNPIIFHLFVPFIFPHLEYVWSSIIFNMNEQLTYRDELIATLSGLENTLSILGGLGLSVVFFEDRQDKCFPFEDGDDIPFSLDLLIASEIPSARILGEVMMELEKVHAYLYNINNLSPDDFTYTKLSEEEMLSYDGGFPVGSRDTLDDLKNEAADYISHAMAFVMNDCYFMKYNCEVPSDFQDDFYFPEESTFDILTSADININKLVDLAKFLLSKRDEAWEHA